MNFEWRCISAWTGGYSSYVSWPEGRAGLLFFETTFQQTIVIHWDAAPSSYPSDHQDDMCSFFRGSKPSFVRVSHLRDGSILLGSSNKMTSKSALGLPEVWLSFDLCNLCLGPASNNLPVIFFVKHVFPSRGTQIQRYHGTIQWLRMILANLGRRDMKRVDIWLMGCRFVASNDHL